jgi:glycosyltransferase involved in cell wall biosynthesis
MKPTPTLKSFQPKNQPGENYIIHNKTLAPIMNVSVVIPALNEEVIIEDCLQSIRRQTIPVEIILIDNGSIDRTPEIAAKYCDKVLIRPEYTLAQMRDLGAIEATGDIIVTTDADCIAPENWIEELIKPFQDPKVVAVGGAFRPLNKNPLSHFYCWCSSIMQGTFGLFQGANMAYTKKAYRSSPGYAEAKRAEDWNLSYQIRKQGKIRYLRRAYTRTEIPFNRQIEYPGGMLSVILSILGGIINHPLLMGLGAGYVGAEMFSFLYKHKSNLRRSHLTLVAITAVYFSRRFLNAFSWYLSLGILLGIFVYYLISEDLRQTIEELKIYKTQEHKKNTIIDRVKLLLIKILDI